MGPYWGSWSPIANEILLASCVAPYDESAPFLARADAPRFDVVVLNTQDIWCESYPAPVMWTPDGQNIMFAGSITEGTNPEGWLSEVWIMTRTGDEPQAIIPGATIRRYLWFIGWMDDQTLVFEGYAGGGHRITTMLDFENQTLGASSMVHGWFRFPNRDYLAGSYWAPQPIVAAMGRDAMPDGLGFGLAGAGGEFVRFLPLNRFEDVRFQTSHFTDWLPGTNSMLVSFMALSVLGLQTRVDRLVLWNLDDGTTRDVAPGGLNGDFSPDGRVLAYMTLGPASLDSAGKPVNAVEYKAFDLARYLQLMYVNSGIVWLSLPIVSTIHDGSSQYLWYESYSSFSPDSKYLAVLTPQLIGDQSASAIRTTDESAFLRIIDLGSEQIILTAPAGLMTPSWSPDSRWLVYRDPHHNPTLLYMTDGESITLTAGGGNRLHGFEWSFDGRYLSFMIKNGNGVAEGSELVILPIP